MISPGWNPAAVEKCVLNPSVLGRWLRYQLNQSPGSDRLTPGGLQPRAEVSCFLLGDENQLHR